MRALLILLVGLALSADLAMVKEDVYVYKYRGMYAVFSGDVNSTLLEDRNCSDMIYKVREGDTIFDSDSLGRTLKASGYLQTIEK